MLDSGLLSVLRKIVERLDSAGVNWVVTGSSNLAVHGMDIKPHDIDVLADRAGAYRIEKLFSDFVTRKVVFSSAKRIRSHYGVLSIDGIKVEIMGDIEVRTEDGVWDKPPDLNAIKRIVEVEGLKIPAQSLDHEYLVYERMGRKKKAEIIKDWLRWTGKSSGSSC
jgi:hypothetical protein